MESAYPRAERVRTMKSLTQRAAVNTHTHTHTHTERFPAGATIIDALGAFDQAMLICTGLPWSRSM